MISDGPRQPVTPRVFVTRQIPEAGLVPLRERFSVDVWPGPLPPSHETLRESVAGCAGILSLLTDRIDVEIMDAAGAGLRVVSNFAVGVDNVDVAEATRRKIPVGNTPGVLTEATADLAWSLLMAAARRLIEGDRYVRSGQWHTWEPQLLLGAEVHGATLGVVGYGRIGQAVARRARGFDMRVLYTRLGPDTREEWATRVSFEQLLDECDFVSIH